MPKSTKGPSSPDAADRREPADGRRRDFLDFLIRSSSGAIALAAVGSLGACGDDDDDALPATLPSPTTVPAVFAFGVASGDPLPDRVVLWTHAKVPDSTADVALTWDVAHDAAFTRPVRSGRVTATASTSFTAKVDATGLTPGTTYFYRFRDATGISSTVGTTRTLPAADVDSVEFAVLSCALYSEGYFHAYDAATRSDALYALHLGDYIYEFGADPTKYGNGAIPGGRIARPANDLVTMNDYRTRYALHRSDPTLQAAHARMPWIAVWDDHEFADNAFTDGASNHDQATQGGWNARKRVAARVYHEWMPIRTPDPDDLLKIHRRFDFGRLFTLHMLDTRIEGRDRAYDAFGDADGGIARYLAGLTPAADGSRPDAARRMMSAGQQDWLTAGMAASNATWQVLGNQTLMGRMWMPRSVLATFATDPAGVPGAVAAYLGAKATRAAAGAGALSPAQSALLDPVRNPRLPFNLDAWDGYPAQREAILQAARTQGRRLVVLSGDSHNAWFAHLTTLGGERAGVEFATPSITSTGFEALGLGALAPSIDGSALAAQMGDAAVGAGLGLIDDVAYCDTARRGYVRMTVTHTAITGEYVFVSSVKQPTYTTTVGRTVTVAATAGGMAAPVFA
jgi:alkaline phosphatase D